jgi:cell wall-associated NlpC family hydrolase
MLSLLLTPSAFAASRDVAVGAAVTELTATRFEDDNQGMVTQSSASMGTSVTATATAATHTIKIKATFYGLPPIPLIIYGSVAYRAKQYPSGPTYTGELTSGNSWQYSFVAPQGSIWEIIFSGTPWTGSVNLPVDDTYIVVFMP